MEEIINITPKLSVITINLNDSCGLENSIRSTVNQSFTDYELIVIDGGSSDKSIEVIKKYSERIAFWISETDTGVYNAMNKGITKATGEYCYFLNSGDYLADNKVFEKIFEKNPVEDILFGNIYVTINGKVIGKSFGKETLTFSDVYSNTVKHQASFIKRSLFNRFGMYNEARKIVADWEFFIKTLGFGDVTFRYLNLFISYFDNNGISNNNGDVTNKERVQVIQENIPIMMQPDYEFLQKYSQYECLYRNRYFFFFVRLISKILRYIDKKI